MVLPALFTLSSPIVVKVSVSLKDFDVIDESVNARRAGQRRR